MDRRQDITTGGKVPTGGRRQAAGGRRQAAGGRRQAAGGRRQDNDVTTILVLRLVPFRQETEGTLRLPTVR